MKNEIVLNLKSYAYFTHIYQEDTRLNLKVNGHYVSTALISDISFSIPGTCIVSRDDFGVIEKFKRSCYFPNILFKYFIKRNIAVKNVWKSSKEIK